MKHHDRFAGPCELDTIKAMSIFFVILACAVGYGGDQPASTDYPLATGPWRAWLHSPGGELPFGLELQNDKGAWKAWLINGSDRAEVPRVEVSNNEVVLSISHYGSTIRAKISEGGAKLDGEWTKQGRNDKLVKLPFHAAASANPRFRSSNRMSTKDAERLSGRWSMRFAKDSEATVLVLNIQPGGVTTGSILTPTGDYGFLEGVTSYSTHIEHFLGEVRLSTFDGAHAFLIVGAPRSRDGLTMEGDFWSGDTFHDTWTAKRDDDATLPDGFTMTKGVDGAKLSEIVFPDLDGKQRSLADPALAGKARIIEVFGSWCPNCNDASRYLVELHNKYKDRGLSIVGVAFELTGDFTRDAGQVRTFATHHGIKYPLLLAGIADREKVSAAMPILDKFRAYPTIIILDGKDRIRAVYTGFSGPATGEEYAKLRTKFETLIEELLGGPQSNPG